MIIYENVKIIYTILRESEEDNLLDNVMMFGDDGATKI